MARSSACIWSVAAVAALWAAKWDLGSVYDRGTVPRMLGDGDARLSARLTRLVRRVWAAVEGVGKAAAVGLYVPFCSRLSVGSTLSWGVARRSFGQVRRDLLLQIINYCRYMSQQPEMTPTYIDYAVENYFAIM